MTAIHPIQQAQTNTTPIGVGLRHEHYSAALLSSSHSVDFVEIHAENFFAEGGAASRLLDQITERYKVSIHGTAMGLGSAKGIQPEYLKKFTRLVNRVDPLLVSDHACFTWGNISDTPVHAGDLLPLKFDQATLTVLANNIDRVQQALGRQLLIENIVSYKQFPAGDYSEAEFLATVAEKTGCGLLVDLNNVLVNYHNFTNGNALQLARQWLRHIPANAVKEIHLAGSSPVAPGMLIVDDHAQPVSNECWQLFDDAMTRFPAAATLIEWDNDLPSWPRLVYEADKARCRQAMAAELMA
ncbi:DUF692 domain-containing protein [Alteromonas gilva]|uniref:DUF692 domain-containing protein n=1 Tax=Alteromonas gilva TaxID=2987522 RepID=A0ABT5KYD1_9ALTE|nr:DUF692 domain-containing protein [Alteromonas gilva]MDC8829780.1 DUF692 domain-containing protein [Alteromonas gilva]